MNTSAVYLNPLVLKRILCYISVLCISIHAFSQVDLNWGLIAYFPFTGHTDDASGNGNHGLNHNVGFTMSRFGKFGEAAAFNGSDSYVEIPNNASFSLKKGISVCAWIYCGTMETAGRVVCNWHISGEGIEHYLLSTSSGKLSIKLTPYESKAGEIAIDENKWHFVAFIVEDTKIKLVLDDQYVMNDTIAIPDDIPVNTVPVFIGGGGSGNAMPVYIFNGSIDDVMFYDRALGEPELEALYGGLLPTVLKPSPWGTDIGLYPNPVSDILHIDVLDTELSDIVITGADGITVKRATLSGRAGQVDMGNLHSGIYMVRITCNDRVLLQKIIKK